MKICYLIGVLAMSVATARGDDPVPLRREVIAPERLAAELDPARRGSLVRLTREEFESRVRRAGIKPTPPQLLAARYEARREGADLVGTGRWTVRQAGPRAGLLVLDPLDLALSAARWSDGSPWVAGELDRSVANPGMELLVEPGERTAEFAWSARGRDGRWELRCPACAVTVLTLDLPAGTEPVAPADQVVINGPAPAADPQLRRWTLAGGFKSSFTLLIRATHRTEPTLFANVGGRFDLHARQVDAAYTINVAATGGRFREIVLEHDATVRVFDVRAPGVESWTPEPPQAGVPRRIRVVLAAPANALTMSCSGQMTLATNGAWRAPLVAIAGAVSLGETIAVSVAPDVSLDEWRDGSFRRTSVRSGPTGTLDINLVAPVWSGEVGRPGGLIRSAGRGLDVAQHLQWYLDPERRRLDVAIDLTPRHEVLGHWEFALPPGWELESVESRDAARLTWSIRGADSGRPTVAIDFAEVVPVGAAARITARFQGRPNASGDAVDFPELHAAGTRVLHSALEVFVNPLLSAKFAPAPSCLPQAIPAGPYVGSPPNALFTAVGAATAGTVRVRARPGRFAAESATNVRVVDGQPRCNSLIQLRPEAGVLDAVTVRSPAAPPTGTWRSTGSTPLRAVVPLDAMTRLGWAMAAPVWTVAALVPETSARAWRLQFVHPVTGGSESLEFEAGLTATGTVVAPLWWVDGASAQKQSFTLTDDGGEFGPPKTLPGQVVLPRRDDGAQHPKVSPQMRGATLMSDGRWLHRYSAQVRNPGAVLTFELPEAAELLVTRVDQRIAAVEAVGAGRWRLPVQAGRDHAVEMFLAMPADGWLPVRRLEAVEPRFAGPSPIDAGPYHWNLPTRLVPLGVSEFHAVPDQIKTWDGIPTVDVVGTATSLSHHTIWVMDRVAVMQCGLILTAFMVAVCLQWGHYFGNGVALAALIVAAMSLGLLPAAVAWWLAGPALVPLLWVAGRRMVRAGGRVPPWLAPTVVATAVWSSSATEPPPTTVLIVPGQPDAAYVPAEVLDRLDELANAGGPQVDAAVVAARYVATADEMNCRIDAQWDVHSFRAGAVLEIPSGGAPLEDLSVDGRPAFPQLQGDTVRISLPAAGLVRVSARQAVAVEAAGSERSMRLQLPACPQARLELKLPAGARLSLAPTGRGAVRVAGDHVEAELGATNVTNWAWNTAAAPKPAEAPKLSEAYLWDFLGPTARLLAVWEAPATVGPIRLTVPAQLALRSAYVVNSKRPLEVSTTGTNIELLAPAEGGTYTILAELVPRAPISAAAALPFPTCRGATSRVWGWRGRPGEHAPSIARGVVAVNDSVFQRHFKTDEPMIARAYRPAPGADMPFIRVQHIAGPKWKGPTVFHWRLGPKAAYVTAEAQLFAGRDPATMVEWDVPAAVQVTDVSGTGLARWSRSGERLQVWLDQPRSDVQVTWFGQIARANEAARFDTPIVRGLGIDGEKEIVVSARPGWDLAPVAVQQLTAAPGAPTGRTWTFRGNRPAYRLLLQLRPAATDTEYRLETAVDEIGGQPQSTTVITAQVRRGDVRSFAIHVRADPADEVHINAPNAAITNSPGDAHERVWVIDLPPGSGDTYRASVRCRPPKAAKTWALPSVRVDVSGQKPAALDQWLSTKPGLTLRELEGLDAAGVRKWRVTNENWSATVDMSSP